ncbi:hypothetical protein [Alloalcanivorax mobilis]|uniref:hypothetical protein n=1 Tax=Alloalcanivorax mobilis TaxID=2019569 RepID=UPI000B5B3B0A|nr:hypothetical protein [Alloalcanivorax mobilis]ASK35457.1 hypothetical protein CEK62_14265 [Alcanivorax sp. N3-2A]|tara:strand:- start:6597 stop:7010 length:414 start_codon:yes stop_codon:yes gene_type:complete
MSEGQPQAGARRTVRFWAGLDLLLTLPLVLPPTARLLLDTLVWLNHGLGLPGVMGPRPALAMLFACLAGALAVTWALARWTQPLAALGRLDAWARIWVGALILGAVLDGLPAVLVLFVITEWAGALHQFWCLRKQSC